MARMILFGIVLIALTLTAGTGPAAAQAETGAEVATTTDPDVESASAEGPVTLGLDVVSRYVWRGLVFGDSPCLQPWAGVSVAGFSLGTWGSLAIAPPAGADDGSTLMEVDLTLARSLALPAGTLTATLADYHYPSDGRSYFESADDSTGSHTLEAGLTYRGPERFPLGLCGTVNIHHDDDHAAYLEATWPLTAGTVAATFVAGVALGSSALYAVEEDGLHCTEAGVTVSRPLPISTGFEPILKVSWIVNPHDERVHLVAALSI